MKRSKILGRVVFGLLGLGLVGALIVGLRSDFRSDIGKTVTLPDGTKLTLRAVTYGKENRYPGDTAWQRCVSMLPAWIRKKIQGSSGAVLTADPQVMLWIERKGSASPNNQRFFLADASGYEIPSQLGIRSAKGARAQIEGHELRGWPRREASFKVRVYQQGKAYGDDTFIGEFTVRNPTPRKYPSWTPATLPVTNQVGDLTVVLREIVTGVGVYRNTGEPASSPTTAGTRLGFEIFQNGARSSNWRMASLESSDATGNHFPQGLRTTGAEQVTFSPHPWPAESAWKLRVGFARQNNFADRELWTSTITIPQTNEPLSFLTRTNLNGTTLECLGSREIVGPPGSLRLFCRAQPVQAGQRLTFVSAVDDLGRPVRPARPAVTSDDGVSFQLEFNVNPVATNLTVTLAFHQTRYFEFTVKPEMATTNSAAAPK